MPKDVLPKSLKLKIIGLFESGMSFLEIFDEVYEEAFQYVTSETQLSRCIGRLKREADILQDEKEVDVGVQVVPRSNSFDNTPHMDIINSLPGLPNKDFEKACHPIVNDILTNYEGFSRIISSNGIKGFHNPPFDYLAYKNGKKFIIEFKGSLKNFNTPGETQKRRMQELLRRIQDLNIALLQVKVIDGKYRILCNDEMNLLFDGREIPLDRVVNWILEQNQDENPI